MATSESAWIRLRLAIRGGVLMLQPEQVVYDEICGTDCGELVSHENQVA